MHDVSQISGSVNHLFVVFRQISIIQALKVLVLIHSLILPNVFKHMEILVPEVELYLECFMCEISSTNSL